MVKSLPAMWETWVQSLGWEDPLEKEMATHFSILAWEIPWTVAYQAPPSMEFSRLGCWSGLPFPSPEDLPSPGIESGSLTLQADAFPSEPPGKPGSSEVSQHFLNSSGNMLLLTSSSYRVQW